MSDPRYTDPSGRGDDLAGLWSWLAPLLTALGLLIGGIIGYNWGYSSGAEHERSAEVRPPATTGSAPSHTPGAP
jgi:hypothetical protein